MKTPTKKKVTVMLDTRVYEGLRDRVGSRGIGAFLSQIALPHVSSSDLEADYQALADDEDSKRLADEWLGAVDEPIEDENVWPF